MAHHGTRRALAGDLDADLAGGGPASARGAARADRLQLKQRRDAAVQRRAAVDDWYAGRDAVQRRGGGAEGGGAEGEGSVHDIAASGVAGAGGALPHRDAIQKSFGRHDVGGIGAHVGGAARDASDQIGAEAYATGDQVAFRKDPDLHTAAHEAAHVVQQRSGVHLKGGVGAAGDAYEQHADAVADAVVQGKSAEGLLDRAPGGGGDRGAVQRKGKDDPAPPAQGQQQGKGKAKHTHTGDALTTAYNTLMGIFGALNAPGSAQFDLGLGLNIGLGKVASISGTIKLGVGANMQDDRRIRVHGSIGFELAAGVDMGFWKAKVGVELTRKGTWVFDDVAHLCAWAAKNISDYVAAARKYVTAKAQDQAAKENRDLTPAEKAEMLKLRRQKALVAGKAKNDPTTVETNSVKVKASGEAGSGFEGSVSGSRSTSTFTRTNRKTGLKETTQSTQTEFEVKVKLGDITGTVTYTKIAGHANPDNDGTYLNIKIEGGPSTETEEAAMQGVVKTLSGMVPQAGADPKAFASKLIEKMKSLLGNVAGSKKKITNSKSLGVELNYVDKNGWRLQYARLFHARSKNAEVTVPIGGAFSLTGSASGSVDAVLPGSEILGDNTLTYAQTVYNGMARKGSGGEAMWRGWATSHQAQLWALMGQAGKKGTNAYAEAHDGAFKPFGVACASAVKSGQLAVGKFDSGVYGKLFSKMESVFEAAGNEKSGWIPKERVNGTVKSLKGHKVVLGDRMTCPVKFKGWGATLGDFVKAGGWIELDYAGWRFTLSPNGGSQAFIKAFQKKFVGSITEDWQLTNHTINALQHSNWAHWDHGNSSRMQFFWNQHFTTDVNSRNYKLATILTEIYLKSIYDALIAARSPALYMGES